jgi:hypothetical protein
VPSCSRLVVQARDLECFEHGAKAATATVSQASMGLRVSVTGSATSGAVEGEVALLL